jgi:hypothetical protein
MDRTTDMEALLAAEGYGFTLSERDALDRECPVCGHMIYIRDHGYRDYAESEATT